MSRAILRNMAIALSLHPWNNSPEEWQRLQEAVAELGATAPKAAKAALAARAARLARLPNPFAN
jgi:hypothetical protein